MLNHCQVRIFDHSYKVYGYGDEGWFNILAQTGAYNEFNLDNLRPYIKPDSVCLDVGANLGIMTLAMAALCPQGMVCAFEPDPKTFTALEKTIAVGNSGWPHIATYSWAIGTQGTQGAFIEDPDWRSSSHFIPGNGTQRTHSIDAMNFDHVDLIKIDVEGCELDVLEGAIQTLHRCMPVVLMEFNTFAFVHYRNLIPRKVLDEIFEIFSYVGYFEKRVGKLVKLEDREAFLRNNFLGGFVDDLCLQMGEMTCRQPSTV